MIDMLRNIPSLNREEPTFCESISDLAFVPNAGDGNLQKACDLYSATNELEGLLDATSFPAATFMQESDVAMLLLQLGMKPELDVQGAISAAQSVTKLWGEGTSESKQRAQDRSRNLLLYLDMHCSTIALPHQVDEFEAIISGLMWLPVLTSAPDEGLPWNQNDTDCPPFGAALMTRPKDDMWLVSHAMNILDGEVSFLHPAELCFDLIGCVCGRYGLCICDIYWDGIRRFL